MKIVIFGLAKSGTTALFFKIRNSFPPDTICLFEPKSFDPWIVRTASLKALLSGRRAPDLLAKVLPFAAAHPVDTKHFEAFDRQILIVRDPRDRLISRLLYGIYDSKFYYWDTKVRAFLELLKQKEAHPTSLPVKSLMQTFIELNGESWSFDHWVAERVNRRIQMSLDFHDRHQNLFLYKYEDLIDQKFSGLEEYLGVKLKGDASVSPAVERVVRTKSYGNWRDWLTTEDVEYLRPSLQLYLDRYYRETDWELNPSPSIPAKYASGYVERVVNDKRHAMKLPPFSYARRN